MKTFWRPSQEKPFIFVQTLFSGGQRGSQRLSQECWYYAAGMVDKNKDELFFFITNQKGKGIIKHE